MILWIDAQFSPSLASWIAENFKIEARAIRDLGLLQAKDEEIYKAARQAKAVVMTKDSDFMTLVEQQGVSPQVVWVTCGNTSNAYLKKILKEALPAVIRLIDSGESVVEVSDTQK